MKTCSALLLACCLVLSSTGLGLAADKEIVIGCNFTMSGPAASLGIAGERSVKRAAELINKDGFVIQGDRYRLKIVIYDNKYVPAESVTNVEKMLAEGIRFVYSQGSGNSVPVVEKTTAAKALQMSYASGKNHLTSPKFPYSFRTVPTNESAYAMYPWLKKTYPQIVRVGHMNPSDEAGFTESEDRRMLAEKAGFQNVANEYFKRGATDYYPVATKIIAAKPDFIDFGGTIGRDQALAVKALRELGYKGMVAIGYSDAKAFVDIAGAQAAEGTILFNTLVEAQTEQQKQLHDWYLKQYGAPVPTAIYDYWDPMFMLVEGMKKANSVDPVKVAEVLPSVRWKGLFGDMKYGMKPVYQVQASMTRDIPMAVVKGGQPKYLTTIAWPKDVE
jgi:branched-chain amino acid transport system substrate-binding protein